MKVSLIHCYSDFNKGDLGIILSTIEVIKEVYPKAEINAVSTYNYNDSQYKDDHLILKKYVHNLYSSIFGLLFIDINGKKFKSGIAKMIKFAFEYIRLMPLLILPRSKYFIKLLLNKHERKTFTMLMNSNVIISKGGSFICNEDNLRSKIAYIRLMYIFRLLKKYDKKYYILGQSLGPVYGKRSIKILNDVLRGSEKTYLREDVCLKNYPYIDKSLCSKVIVNDVAFTLNKFESIDNIQFDNQMKVGLTIKHLYDVHQSYKNMILGAIRYLCNVHQAKIFIFPQVTVDNDLIYGEDIFNTIEEEYRHNIIIIKENLTPYQLRLGYSKMKFLIGTRLHSTIFAMSAGIPAINIAYHGTKSQGIYKNMKVTDLLIEKNDFSTDYLISLIKNLLDNYEYYKELLEDGVRKTREIITQEIKQM